MKQWIKPEIQKLDVKNTQHSIRWESKRGWCKWNGSLWAPCGEHYQPTQDDVIVGAES